MSAITHPQYEPLHTTVYQMVREALGMRQVHGSKIDGKESFSVAVRFIALTIGGTYSASGYDREASATWRELCAAVRAALTTPTVPLHRPQDSDFPSLPWPTVNSVTRDILELSPTLTGAPIVEAPDGQ